MDYTQNRLDELEEQARLAAERLAEKMQAQTSTRRIANSDSDAGNLGNREGANKLLKIGARMYAPGERFGNLTLIELSYTNSSVVRRNKRLPDGIRESRMHQGNWRAVCDCGTEVVVHYRALYYNTLSGRCCGDPKCDPDPRPKGRPADMRHVGETYGRLLILDWEAGKGWLAHCNVCEEMEEHDPILSRLVLSGMKYCKNRPVTEQ